MAESTAIFWVALVLAAQPCAAQLISSCDFGVSSSQNLCGYTHGDSNILARWRFGSSCTPTAGTGPCSDHTGNSSGNFLYVESDNQRNGSRIRLNSPSLTASGNFEHVCLQFFYYMYGDDVGTLNVYFNGEVAWTQSGQKGNAWLRTDVELNLGTTSGSTVLFNVTFEAPIFYKQPFPTNVKGDIAIDDVSIVSGTCQNRSEEPPTTSYPQTSFTPIETTSATRTIQQRCTFETDSCGFYNKREDQAWTRSNGMLVRDISGPATDKTLQTSNGSFYLFRPLVDMDASGGRMLVSPRLEAGVACLSFFYYIFGNASGFFNVYADVEAEDMRIWTSTGLERGTWILASISLPNNTISVSFEGAYISGKSFYVAIDDLIISQTQCSGTSSYTCDFGTSLSPVACGYTDVNQGPMKWLSQTGCTTTANTGPCSDHTGNRLGAYRYIESSYRSNGTRALLKSPAFVKNVLAPGGCLQFYYHMYGEDIGSLNVYLNESLIWSLSGEQGNLWLRANVELNLFAVAEEVFQISFEAVILNNKGLSDLKGDIGIDDIDVTVVGSCVQTSETRPPTTLTSAAPTPTESPISESRQCNFERGTCGLLNKRQTHSWMRGNGATVPGGQPSTDKTFGNGTGMFMYYRGLSPSAEGNSSILISPRVLNVGCLKFSYFISGPSRCTLNLYTDQFEYDTLQWSTQGSDRDRWVQTTVELNGMSMTFSFEAVHDEGDNFVIAIDDVELVDDGGCSERSTTTNIDTSPLGSTLTTAIHTTVAVQSSSSNGVSSLGSTLTDVSHRTVFTSTSAGVEVTDETTTTNIVGLILGVVGGLLAVVLATVTTMCILKKKGRCNLSLQNSALSIKYSRKTGGERAYLHFDNRR